MYGVHTPGECADLHDNDAGHVKRQRPERLERSEQQQRQKRTKYEINKQHDPDALPAAVHGEVRLRIPMRQDEIQDYEKRCCAEGKMDGKCLQPPGYIDLHHLPE